MPLLSRMWASRRALTLVEAFRRADRFRREGRLPEAMAMVGYGLGLDPDNITGHLLAAYLHAAGRAMAPAKAEFQWVLGRDPHHARALLGLARIALEEGQPTGCRELLGRALRFYPEFPEAQALLGAVTALAAPAPPAVAPVTLDRLRLPDHGRSLVVARHDGALVGTGDGDDDEATRAAALARILVVAAAALTRGGFGAVRRAIVEDREEAVFARTDGAMLVALTLPRTTAITQGLLEVNRLWAGVRQVDAPASSSAPGTAATTAPESASDRRAS
ncbi:MAG: tetratricopeptide repeat protein [Candidatus Rokuibacteriota bacterium]